MTSPASSTNDPTFYRVEDDVGEHELQTYILELLRPLVERYLADQQIDGHVGSDQFIYWRQHEPQACVAPDLYVLPRVPQSIAIETWKVWEQGVVPTLALEVVGRNPRKDYEDAPLRYAELGVDELIVFDPFIGPDRFAFTVYRRQQGSFLRVQQTQADRVWSQQLGCYLRKVGEDAATRLRLATGPDGNDLLPTPEEKSRAEGRELGRAEGLHQGRAEATRDLLRRHLRTKFGPLSPEHESFLDSASLEALDRYADRLLTAPSIDAVLTD